ncbi:Maf family protein [Parasediminibacterium paludis]|uniref:dTTP/UTP pyrophosphatase n=1 Tax=Parasediminibacterium paludis TaxID=908966 RepID=A0ABV8PW05_9BACT
MSSIILASQSPRRKQLLEWAEIDFEVIVKATDEVYPPNLSVEDVPVYIAREKALAVQTFAQTVYHAEHRKEIIIAADTVVVLDDRIIGKPADRQEAIATLTSLSGKAHRVITGVVILEGKKEIAFADITKVWFHELTQAQIEFYIDKYQPYDKAGAYGIQDWIGVVGIKAIEGDFYNVMGLPISRVVQQLQLLKN